VEGQQKLFRAIVKGNHVGRHQGLALPNWFVSFLSLLLLEGVHRYPKASRSQVRRCIVEAGSGNICSCSHDVFSLYFPQSMQDSSELWLIGSVLGVRLLRWPRCSPPDLDWPPQKKLGRALNTAWDAKGRA